MIIQINETLCLNPDHIVSINTVNNRLIVSMLNNEEWEVTQVGTETIYDIKKRIIEAAER